MKTNDRKECMNPAFGAPYEGVVPGYEGLSDVLHRAYLQAAKGKGSERHARAGECFEDQVMQDMAKRFGVGALLAQAFKKSEESQRLPHDRAIAELLGAINYLAGAVIRRELDDLALTLAEKAVGPTKLFPPEEKRSALSESLYETQRGDSLASIALRELGSQGQWRAIADLNAHEFPGMPLSFNTYFPIGTMLRMPVAKAVL